jgi:hypothetical protein
MDWHKLPFPVLASFSCPFGADDMPTHHVVLSAHQHELVETLVQSGRYQNASEVLREGLRLIEDARAH